MNLCEHMQNGHQDHVEFRNSEWPGQGEEAGGLLPSYNSHTAICFCAIAVHVYIITDF